MVEDSTAEEKLKDALNFIKSDGKRTRDFVIARSTTIETDDGPQKGYDLGELGFDTNIVDEIEDIVADRIHQQIDRAVEGDAKTFEPYHISNVDKDVEPVQYLEADEIPAFGRFEELVTNPDIEDTSFEDDDRPEFQTVRTKDPDGNMVVAFQKYSNRQILGSSYKIKFSLSGGNQYDRVKNELLAIPERVDALYYDGLVFVFNPSKFEDIFDYLEMYESRATEVFEGLDETEIQIHNFEEFAKSVHNDRRALRKMRQIQELGLYRDLKQDEVEGVVNKFDLDIQVGENEAGEWGITVPDMRKKWDVIRLLNDDHLYSSLTEGRYQVYGKDER